MTACFPTLPLSYPPPFSWKVLASKLLTRDHADNPAHESTIANCWSNTLSGAEGGLGGGASGESAVAPGKKACHGGSKGGEQNAWDTSSCAEVGPARWGADADADASSACGSSRGLGLGQDQREPVMAAGGAGTAARDGRGGGGKRGDDEARGGVRIVAVDLQEMAPIDGVMQIQASTSNARGAAMMPVTT